MNSTTILNDEYGSNIEDTFNMPTGCIEAFYSNSKSVVVSKVAPIVSENLANVQYLYKNGVINWPNFTVINYTNNVVDCMPICGLCTSHSGDSIYYVFNLCVIGALLPIVGMCGIIGNSLSAFVYSRSTMRKHSTNLYLCALGCSDNAVIITALFLFFIDSIKRHSATLSVIYGQLSPVIYQAGMMAQTCSVYFTLIAGFDCFVQVCLTNKLKNFCETKSCIRNVIVVVLFFSFFYNVPHLFEAILIDCWHSKFKSRSVDVCPAPFRFNPTYMTVYYKYMYSLFLAVGPLIILIVLNSCIIFVTLYKSKRKKLLEVRACQSHYESNPYYNCYYSTNQKVHNSKVNKKNLAKPDFVFNTNGGAAANIQAQLINSELTPNLTSTMTTSNTMEDNMALILVVLLFICCNMIALLINVFETHLSNLLEWRINYIIDISNLLVVFNSSFNIIIYYNFSSSFNKVFCKKFCRQKTQKWKSISGSSSSTEKIPKQNGKKVGFLENNFEFLNFYAENAVMPALANCKEPIEKSSKNIIGKCACQPEIGIKNSSKCSKCVCRMLFDSGSPLPYRYTENNKKNKFTSGQISGSSSIVPIVFQFSNEHNTVLQSQKTNQCLPYIDTTPLPYINEALPTTKIVLPPHLTKPNNAIVEVNSPNIESIKKREQKVLESPHSNILFHDYEEEIKEYMDSCTEFENLPFKTSSYCITKNV